MLTIRRLILFFTIFLSCEIACFGQNQVEIVFLQLNDTYEIAPLANGTIGGLARVATVYKELKNQNPHTFFVHAGDFLNPSVIGSLRFENQRIRGRQMIEVMNAMGLQYVCFGNHEFDLEYEEVQARINESDFTWLATNIQHILPDATVKDFSKTKNQIPEALPKSLILTAGKVKIGLLGLMLPINRDYVKVHNADNEAIKAYNQLKDSTDFVVAITHQSIDEDRNLAQKIPELKLIMGGHEHENIAEKMGEVYIRKADANAKTAFIHRLRYDLEKKTLQIRSELKKIDPSIPDDPLTAQVVNKWLNIANQSFINLGFDPQEIVLHLQEPLDGLEASVRNFPTNLTRLIAKALLHTFPEAKAAIFNGGSIRIDDKLEGNLSEYDVLRILPFGGSLMAVEMKGRLLKKVLDIGKKNQGTGGYLQFENISFDKGKQNWLINNKLIKRNKYYLIAINEFLMSGKEANLDFLTEKHPDVRQIVKADANNPLDTARDIRKALIEYLKTVK
jgi:5'-nucleotidase